jgi:hypothetical protein
VQPDKTLQIKAFLHFLGYNGRLHDQTGELFSPVFFGRLFLMYQVKGWDIGGA